MLQGISLGGAIAALIPTLENLHVNAVTFNAPGIKHVPGVKNYEYRVINIRARYDFISAIGEAVGPVWNVDVPEEEPLAKDAFEISQEESKHPILFSFEDIFEKKSILQQSDFLFSVLAQHKMIHLWQALNHTSVDNKSYASFEKLLMGSERHIA